MTRSSLLSGLACLTLISHADEAAPLQLVGTTQIDRSFTAYLREDGNEHVFTLGEGETANGWQISQTTRDAGGSVVRIHLQRGTAGLWLGVAGGSPSTASAAPTATAASDATHLIDTPSSKHGAMHDQLLHRSRLKNKPSARAAHRQVSDLDPFPTKLNR